jgi:hypothetical protein
MVLPTSVGGTLPDARVRFLLDKPVHSRDAPMAEVEALPEPNRDELVHGSMRMQCWRLKLSNLV